MEIQDVVHGTISLPIEYVNIINTEQFQRLKDVTQLGLMPKFEPTGTHTRYEHCIGTYWLAKRMLDKLECNTKSFRYDNKLPKVYRQAVEVAALLHDVGHGPFSHSWEQIADNFHHEENAMACVDAIFACLNENCLRELREHNNYGIELVKAFILGDPTRLPTPLSKQYKFLFEIVNNKQCKVDVDKWDYLQRDHRSLKHLCSPNMDFDDVFLEARVSDDGAHIEYRYCDYHRIYLLFEARWNFHVKCYRLPLNIVCDKLMKRIVKRCNRQICGQDLNAISASVDMLAFLQLTESKVLELGKDCAEYKYLQDVNKIREIPGEFAEEKNLPFDSLIRVESVVDGPGTVMPPDDELNFYGDENEKRHIDRNMNPTKILGFFVLS